MYRMCLNPGSWWKYRVTIFVCVFLHQIETAAVCKMYVIKIHFWTDYMIVVLLDEYWFVTTHTLTSDRQTDRCWGCDEWWRKRQGHMGKNRRDNSPLISPMGSWLESRSTKTGYYSYHHLSHFKMTPTLIHDKWNNLCVKWFSWNLHTHKFTYGFPRIHWT